MQNEKRVVWSDLVKAIAIFFVVWGHAASGTEVYFFRNVLYSFHVPAFLLISGFHTKDLELADLSFKGFLHFLKKQFIDLFVPYLFWGIFFSNFSMANILPILYGSYQTIKTVNPIGALWFVPTFFVARILVRIVLMAFAKVKQKAKPFVLIPVMIVFFVAALLVPSLENGYPFGCNISLMMTGFVLMGYALKEPLKKISEAKIVWRTLAFLIAFIIFSYGTFFRADSLELVCMYKGDYADTFWFFFNAFSGAFALSFFAMIIAQFDCKVTKAMKYIGSKSLGIMFIHVPFIRQITMPLFDAIGFTSPFWLEAFVAGLTALGLSVAVNAIFRHWAPVFIGKKN